MFSKLVKIVLIGASIIYTVMSVYSAFIRHQTTVDFAKLAGLIPMFYALYAETDWLFIIVNKAKNFLLNNTISFTPKFHLFIDIDNVPDILNEINDKIIENGMKIKKHTKPRITSTTLTAEYTVNRALNFTVHGSITTVSDTEVDVSVWADFQVSSRSTKHAWKLFISIYEAVATIVRQNKKRFDVTINMEQSDLSPFYKLTVKPIDAANVKNFRIDFHDDSMRVLISPHEIYASSPESQDIEKILSHYIPLTSVG
ncbi:hypothetical protein EFL45_04355 [Weissella confusa]|uniref:hypothetical protein n=1 Tax=Weissella confusa TaxID=1583 RepID=UPI00223A9A80|nr:hypothetical protein [Weissella confusa]MCT0948672.1 hypothetical protein [Weissella confusa]